jgi:hypothetical protein
VVGRDALHILNLGKEGGGVRMQDMWIGLCGRQVLTSAHLLIPPFLPGPRGSNIFYCTAHHQVPW